MVPPATSGRKDPSSCKACISKFMVSGNSVEGVLKIYSALAALLLLVSASGCATSEPKFYPQGFPQKLEASDLGQVRTTEEGDILFRQKLFAGYLGRLDADVIVKPYSIYRQEHSVPKGTVLQRGLMVHTKHDGVAWCTLEVTATAHSVVGDTARGRSCFVDTNKSGKFDVVYMKGLEWQVPAWVAQPNYRPFSPLGGDIVLRAFNLDAPVPYTKTNDPLKVDTEFALKYEPGNKGLAHIVMIGFKNGFQDALITKKVPVPPSEALPKTIDVDGVKVELISHQDGVLKYRIVSGLSSDEPILVDLD